MSNNDDAANKSVATTQEPDETILAETAAKESEPSAWHAVCRDCAEFEAVGEFDSVYRGGREHEAETGHNVAGARVEDWRVSDR